MSNYFQQARQYLSRSIQAQAIQNKIVEMQSSLMMLLDHLEAQDQQKNNSQQDIFSTVKAEAPISDTSSKTFDHAKDNSIQFTTTDTKVPSNLHQALGNLAKILQGESSTRLIRMTLELQSHNSSTTLVLTERELQEAGQSVGGEEQFRDY